MSTIPPPPENSEPSSSASVPPPPPGYGAAPQQYPTASGYPGPGYQQQITPPSAPPKGGGGLAVAALVLAIIALLLCWIPIVNNLAFVLGLLALALGAIAWFRSRKGRRAGRGLSVAAAVVSVVAMVGVIATQAFFAEVLDEIDGSVSEASGEDTDEPEGTPDAPKVAAADNTEDADAVAVDSVATEDTGDEATPAGDEPAEDDTSDDSDGLALGAPAEVGDYTVTVTDVQLDANEAVLGANSFNEDPAGQYVLVTLDVTYTGDEQGDPWADLSLELAGSDNRIYDTSSCEAVAPNPAMDVPTLTTGGSATFDECFDVPAEALTNPRVSVEDWMSWGDSAVTWRTDERVEGGQDADAPASTPVAPNADGALEVGETAEVGEYSVTVTDVQLDSNDAVTSANPFNDAPTGQYVLATLEVTYTGDEEGDAWLDLTVELAGSDARIYDSSSCLAVTPNPVMDVPTLTNGGSGSFDICFDVPTDALEAPVLHVEELLSFDDEARAAWKTTP